jgi:uncharacterized protein (TIGR03435 family)
VSFVLRGRGRLSLNNCDLYWRNAARRIIALAPLWTASKSASIGAAFLLCLFSLAVQPQSTTTKAAGPKFDVTSVKENVSQAGPSKISSAEPGRFVTTNTPLRFLILYAYQLLDHQLIGAPAWSSNSSFDVVGTYQLERQPTDPEMRIMVQNLLTDRFGLKVHHEQRELPTLVLILARKDGRLGPQLHQSNVDCAQWIAEKRARTDAGGASAVSPSGKRPACMMIATRKFLTGGTRTMEDFAVTLQSMLSRPVVDETGLKGAFDMDLRWSPVDLNADAGTNTSPSDDPSIFTALKEQLGLKLVPERRKFDVLVIDDLKRPTPN